MFDDRSVFTTNILVAEGMYYLVYQAVSTLRTPSLWHGQITHGLWEKLVDPVLRTDTVVYGKETREMPVYTGPK